VNLVRFTANKNNPNYDYILFRRVGDQEELYNKVIKAEGANKIEAEKYDAAGTTGNNAVRTENFTKDDYTGTCLAYMNYAGNYVSYYLNVEEAGDYNVILNVANGRAAFDFDPGMEVDGTKFPATINAKQTGDGEKNEWYNFENLEPVTVTLPKGHSILTLRASEKDKYPNIDYILVEKKQTATQSLKSAAAKKARTAEDTPASEPADSGKIMLVDVYNNPELMDDFLAQLSDDLRTDGWSDKYRCCKYRRYGKSDGIRYSKCDDSRWSAGYPYRYNLYCMADLHTSCKYLGCRSGEAGRKSGSSGSTQQWY